MRQLATRILLFIFLLIFGPCFGTAQTLTSTLSFTASGFVGIPATATTPSQGQTFTNASITVTAIANTANRATCCTSGYYILNNSESIAILGLGTFQITSPTCTFSDPRIDPVKGVIAVEIGLWTCPLVGPSNYPISPVMDFVYSASTPWNMLSSYGPIQAQINVMANVQMTTSGGTLWFSSLGSSGTFQAVFTGMPPPPVLNRVGVLSHVTAGGYWDTKINLINTSSTPVSATVNLYTDNGSAWSLPLATTVQGNTQTATESSVNLTINPNGSALIATVPNPSASSVWGWADVLASGPINGFAILRSTPVNDKPSEATVPLQNSFPQSVTVPYDNTGGYVMGVALVNLGTGSANVQATAWDDSGNQLGAVMPISIPGSGHTAFVLTDQLAATAGKRGIIEFQNPASGISGLGLRFSPAGPFTDVPVILP